MTTITALPTPPSRADSTNFSTRGDAFLGALPTFVTEANAVGSEATAAAAAAAASASAAAASQSTASTAAAAVAAQSPVANAAAAAASAAAAAASAAAAAQTSGAVAATTLSASGAVTLAVLTASKPVFTDAGKNLTSTGVIGISEGGTGSTATPTLGGAVYGTGSAYAATAAGTAGQVLTSNGGAAPTWQTSSGSSGLKNRIINGAMTIDQRNAGAAVTPTTPSAYTLDRYSYNSSAASKITIQQVADAPTGFKYSTKLLVASQYSATAAEVFLFYQAIEGFNCIDLSFGTASAAAICVSFWVKGSVAGTYSVSLRNSAVARSYVGTVSVTTSWAKQTITLTGDTTGTWLTDSGVGLYLTFDLGSGTNFNTTAGAWQAGNFTRTSGSVSFVNQTAGATLNITGVQLELGSVATPFEQRPYGMELGLCQRYHQEVCSPGTSSQYFLSGGMMTSTTAATVIYRSIVPFRANPTLTYSALSDFNIYAGTATSATSALSVLTQIDPKYQNINFTASSALTSGAPVMFYTNTTTARIALSAEL